MAVIQLHTMLFRFPSKIEFMLKHFFYQLFAGLRNFKPPQYVGKGFSNLLKFSS